MRQTTERRVELTELRSYANVPVRLRLRDASEHIGTLRTELLSERSIAVFLTRDGQQGATIYIDEIVAIWPTS